MGLIAWEGLYVFFVLLKMNR